MCKAKGSMDDVQYIYDADDHKATLYSYVIVSVHYMCSQHVWQVPPYIQGHVFDRFYRVFIDMPSQTLTVSR